MTLVVDDASIRSLALCPDGRHLVSGDESGVIKLWDTEDGRELHQFKAHSGRVEALAITQDGNHIASASPNEINVWDLDGGWQTRLGGDGAGRLATFLGPGGCHLITDGKSVWDVETGENVLALPMEPDEVPVAISQDGKLAVSARDDRSLKLWDLTTGEARRASSKCQGTVIGVISDHAGARLISRADDDRLLVSDAWTGRTILTLTGHRGQVHIVIVTPDGSRIVAASSSLYFAGSDNLLTVWDAETGAILCTLKGHVERISGVIAIPGNNRVISAALDGLIKVWDAEATDEWDDEHRGAVLDLAFAPDARFIASAGSDYEVRIWDGASVSLLRTLTGHTKAVTAVAISPDSKRVAAAGLDSAISYWDAETGEELFRRLRMHGSGGGDLCDLAITPDGQYIIAGHIWRTDTGMVKHLLDCEGPVWRVQVTADGRRVIMASEYSGLRIWDIESGNQLHTLEGGRTFRVSRLAITPDGRRILSSDLNNVVALWDGDTGERLCRFRDRSPLAHHGQPLGISVAITPDGERIITGGLDGRIRVWDVNTACREPQTIAAHDSRGTMGLALTEDGCSIISAGRDYQVKVWKVATGDLTNTFFVGARIHSLASRDKLIAVGTSLGAVYLLELCTILPANTGA